METLHTPFVVAVAQTLPAADKAAAIRRIAEMSEEAAAKKAQLLLFPEAYLGGYPRGASFGTTVGKRLDAGRDEFRQYWEQAIDVPGDECRQLGEIAARNQLQLVIGVIERAGHTLYC